MINLIELWNARKRGCRVLGHEEVLEEGDIIYNKYYGHIVVDGLAGEKICDLASYETSFLRAERKVIK